MLNEIIGWLQRGKHKHDTSWDRCFGVGFALGSSDSFVLRG